jgi:DinB superfamily
MQYLTKEQIIITASKIFNAFTQTCNATDEVSFFKHPPGKWSVAENIKHLVVSTNTATLAYTLPAFIVRWIGGKPNRNSRSYEELVNKYKQKLAAGGRASARFVPKTTGTQYGKEKLMGEWRTATIKFIAALKNKTSETKLDDYLVRHPLLGRITLRELCYFTIYHTEHHLNIINNLKSKP